MKRIVSFVILLCVLISPMGTSLGYANVVTSPVSELLSIDRQDKELLVEQLGESIFVFEKTNETVLSLTLASDWSLVSGALHDTSTGQIFYFDNLPDIWGSNFFSVTEDSVDTLKRLMFSEKNQSHITMSNASQPSATPQGTASEYSALLKGKMIQTHGSEIYSRHWDSYRYNNRLANLYYHRYYGVYRQYNVLYTVNTSVDVISAALSFSASSILTLANFIYQSGRYLLTKQEDFVKFSCISHHEKEVQVGSIYPYRSRADYIGAGVGTTLGTIYAPNWNPTYDDHLYNNQIELMKHGINLAINMEH